MRYPRDFKPRQAPQQGAALVVALIFLLLLTILGVTAMTSSSLQEKMAGNLKDQTVAFQAAETALLAGQNWLLNQTTIPTFGDANGLYVPDSTSSTPWWEVSNIWSTGAVTYPNTPSGTGSGGLSTAIVGAQPQYIIEELGQVPDQGDAMNMSTNYQNTGSTMLRITGRGYGGIASAVVMVQSVYSQKW